MGSATTTVIAAYGTLDLVTVLAYGIALAVFAGGFYMGQRLA